LVGQVDLPAAATGSRNGFVAGQGFEDGGEVGFP
jgi:hypothetical protein